VPVVWPDKSGIPCRRAKIYLPEVPNKGCEVPGRSPDFSGLKIRKIRPRSSVSQVFFTLFYEKLG